MKYEVLPLLVLSLLVATAARAEDAHPFPHSPYSIDVIYKEEAAPYIRHVEDNWRIYQVGKANLDRIEKLASTEYHTKNLNLNIRLGMDGLKPVIKSKLQYKGATIYFVFSYSN
jgi:hypothetical protein